MTVTGRNAPPLLGIVGSSTDRNTNATALTVTASTALTLPSRCGAVPVKSNSISDPSMVTVTTIRLGSC